MSADTQNRSHWYTVRRLLPYLWAPGRADLRLRVVVAMAALVAAKTVGVFTPFLLKDAVDALTPAVDGVSLAIVVPTALIMAYGGARILALFFGELRDAVFVRVGQRALRSVALETFRHLHGLSLGYHLGRKTGGLSRIIERGTRGIDFLLRFMLFNILPTLLEIVLISAIFWSNFGWLYALVTFSSLVGYILFTFFVTDWRLKFRRAMNDQDTKANTKAIDSLLNFETVKYFTNEDHEAARYDVALERYERAAVKSQLSLMLLNLGQGVIIASGLVIVLTLAATGVAEGRLTVGEFVLANALLIQIYQPLGFLGFVYREIKQSLTDMEKMFEVLGEASEVQDSADAPALAVDGGRVDFAGVHFHYRDDRPILRGIDFTVEAGKTTALVGSSGAGKSTISRLLFRFYDTVEGRVCIDGQDVQSVTQKSLREAIGVVPQDTVLFNDTIRYNIAYGRVGATDAEIEEAARLAQVHDFIASQPDGYETEVGERGLKLSGGEKQRIAIARTILKNPPILLLDEATSALDSHTEREIQTALEEVSKGRTTIVIAHRLSTVIGADEILVLDAGEIIERGTYSDLMDAQGRFFEMWQKQQEAAEARRTLAAMDGSARGAEA